MPVPYLLRDLFSKMGKVFVVELSSDKPEEQESPHHQTPQYNPSVGL